MSRHPRVFNASEAEKVFGAVTSKRNAISKLPTSLVYGSRDLFSKGIERDWHGIEVFCKLSAKAVTIKSVVVG